MQVDLEYRILTADDVPKVRKFINDYYRLRNPVALNMGPADESCEYFAKVKPIIEQGHSFAAFDQNDVLCGTLLNTHCVKVEEQEQKQTSNRMILLNRSMTQLLNRSVELAKEKDVEKLVAYFTYDHDPPVVRLGFKQIGRVKLSEYVDAFTGKKEFEDFKPPHSSVALYMKDLRK